MLVCDRNEAQAGQNVAARLNLLPHRSIDRAMLTRSDSCVR